jgi:hypothetical protein
MPARSAGTACSGRSVAHTAVLLQTGLTDLLGCIVTEDVIILQCVRWYLRYSLTYRDLKEIMAELGNPGEAEHDSAMKLNRIPG